MEEPPATDKGKLELALEDWEHDAEGNDHLNFNRFTKSIFQIVDKWTPEICVDVYRQFLQRLVDTLTVVDASGSRKLHPAQDVVLLKHEETEVAQEQVDGAEKKHIPQPKRKKREKGRRISSPKRGTSASPSKQSKNLEPSPIKDVDRDRFHERGDLVGSLLSSLRQKGGGVGDSDRVSRDAAGDSQEGSESWYQRHGYELGPRGRPQSARASTHRFEHHNSARRPMTARARLPSSIHCGGDEKKVVKFWKEAPIHFKSTLRSRTTAAGLPSSPEWSGPRKFVKTGKTNRCRDHRLLFGTRLGIYPALKVEPMMMRARLSKQLTQQAKKRERYFAEQQLNRRKLYRLSDQSKKQAQLSFHNASRPATWIAQVGGGFGFPSGSKRKARKRPASVRSRVPSSRGMRFKSDTGMGRGEVRARPRRQPAPYQRFRVPRPPPPVSPPPPPLPRALQAKQDGDPVKTTERGEPDVTRLWSPEREFQSKALEPLRFDSGLKGWEAEEVADRGSTTSLEGTRPHLASSNGATSTRPSFGPKGQQSLPRANGAPQSRFVSLIHSSGRPTISLGS